MARALSRRATLLIAAGAVLVLGAGAAFVATTGDETKTVRFTQSDESFANPERGWYDRVDILNQRDFTEETSTGGALLHSYIELDDYRNVDIPDDILDDLSDGLSAVRDSGMKIILRVAYNQGPYPDSEPDATLDQMKRHLAQLSPILADNVDVIYSMEAGFLGAWGEWHTSTHGYDLDPAAKQELYDALMSAIPASREVAFRYPSDLRALIGEPATADDVAQDDARARSGNHQDCFLAGPDDNGTWARDGKNSTDDDKAFIAAQGLSTVVGGETCNSDVPERASCDTALSELDSMHFSYLNRDFEENTLQRFRDEGCYDEIGDRLGYRFSLNQATITGDPQPGASLGLELNMQNIGFAPLVNERTAYLVLTSGSTRVELPLDTDPRSWLPGSETKIETKLALPADLADGTYTLSLWLPDAADSLKDIPGYSIRLADDGVWDAKTGMNTITDDFVIGDPK
jgi:hypothetical protein